MATLFVTDSDLAAVADAIRAKGGTSAQLVFPAGFVSAIQALGDWTSNGIANRTQPNGEVTINNVTIADYAYQYRPVAKLNLRNLTGINNRAFDSCTSLTEVSLHGGYFSFGQNVFAGCTALTKATVVYGNASFGELKTGTFTGCTHLAAADLGPRIRNIAINAFKNCAPLQTLILRRSEAPVTLSGTSAFADTPLASGGAGCTIFIPTVLYDHLGDGTSLDYQAAANWSVYQGCGTITWAKLEGSAYETLYLDGEAV